VHIETVGKTEEGTLVKVAATTEREPFHPFVPQEMQIADHNIDRANLTTKVRRDLLPSEKPHQIGPAVLTVRGCEWLSIDSDPAETRFFAVRVYSLDEWAQLHEAEFGRAVKGFDQNDEAKQQRQTGGTNCGMVVKVGRRTGVLGPEREGLVLVVPAPADEPAVDGKSAGAGETLRDEQDQFVAGDTPGGVVNSDPND
jgi:hypothetical protein